MPNTESHTSEIARLNFRLLPEAKEKIERAAVASGLTVTDEVLERHHTHKLSNRDRDIFLALLDADDEPNEALKSAFQAHDKLIAK